MGYVKIMLRTVFKTYFLCKDIERALGFKLYRWQKRYIFKDGKFIRDVRGNGKTTAHIIKMCIDVDAEPLTISLTAHQIHTHPDCEKEWMLMDFETPRNKMSYEAYMKEFKRIYDTLQENNIPVRDITFYEG